jgi:hypothetical protein
VILEDRVHAFDATATYFEPLFFGPVVLESAVLAEEGQFAQTIAATNREAPFRSPIPVVFDEFVRKGEGKKFSHVGSLSFRYIYYFVRESLHLERSSLPNSLFRWEPSGLTRIRIRG